MCHATHNGHLLQPGFTYTYGLLPAVLIAQLVERPDFKSAEIQNLSPSPFGLITITMRQEAKVSRLGWEFCWACMYFSNIFSSYDVISAHAVVYQRLTQEQHAFDGVKMSSLLLSSNKSGVNFEDKWHELKPTVNKLLKQEPVTTQEWQNLFW